MKTHTYLRVVEKSSRERILISRVERLTENVQNPPKIGRRRPGARISGPAGCLASSTGDGRPVRWARARHPPAPEIPALAGQSGAGDSVCRGRGWPGFRPYNVAIGDGGWKSGGGIVHLAAVSRNFGRHPRRPCFPTESRMVIRKYGGYWGRAWGPELATG